MFTARHIVLEVYSRVMTDPLVFGLAQAMVLIEPAHEILVLIACVLSEGSAETAHLRSLGRAFAAHTQNVRA